MRLMSDQPDLIRHSDLLNRLVLDRKSTEELGRVERVWMHPPVHRVLGFICKSGLLGSKRFAFNLQQVKSLGSASIVVDSTPVETNAVEVGHLETLIGNELWSDGGDQIGKIIDCLFNQRTGVIKEYLFKAEGWQGVTGKVYRLPPHRILNFGKKRVLVAAAVTNKFPLYQEGIEQRLSKAGDRLAERYNKATQELQGSLSNLQSSLSDQTQEVVHQARGRLQQWKKTASEQMNTLTHQATQRAKSVSQHLGEETQTLAQEGQSLLDRLQEQLEHLGSEGGSKIKPPPESISDPPQPTSLREDPNELYRDWSFGLDDIAPEDLEDDDPWV